MRLVKIIKLKKNIKSKPKTNFKNLSLKILLLGICYILLVHSDTCQQGIKNGISLCINTLIPSLFPFMMLASFTINSEIFENPNPVFSKLTEKLFYLPGYTYPTIFLSFIGGYPIGAKMIKTLYEKNKINSEQLNRMMRFCTNSGPAFTISMLGETLLKNKTIGIIIFFSQVIAGISVGIICGIKAKISKKTFYFSNNKTHNKSSAFQEALITAICSTCEAMMQMCTIITIFVTTIYILNGCKILELTPLNFLKINLTNIKAIAISIFEITYGCIYAANNKLPYQIVVFAIVYGGFCTHLQIAAILKKSTFKYINFLVFRLINALLSVIIFYLMLPMFETVSPVFSTISKNLLVIKSSSPPVGSISLIVMCTYFIIDINHAKNKYQFTEKK